MRRHAKRRGVRCAAWHGRLVWGRGHRRRVRTLHVDVAKRVGEERGAVACHHHHADPRVPRGHMRVSWRRAGQQLRERTPSTTRPGRCTSCTSGAGVGLGCVHQHEQDHRRDSDGRYSEADDGTPAAAGARGCVMCVRHVGTRNNRFHIHVHAIVWCRSATCVVAACSHGIALDVTGCAAAAGGTGDAPVHESERSRRALGRVRTGRGRHPLH